MRKQKQEENRTETVMYIGPSIPEIVQEGTVFNNGLPGELEEFVGKYPMAKSFLVTMDEASRKRREVKTKGSGLNILYNRLANR